MTRVLITGIGGSIGIDVCRSLRADNSIHITGADCDRWGLELGRRLCDSVIELPRADRDGKAFTDVLDTALVKNEIDFIFINPDPELETVAAEGWIPARSHSMPTPQVLKNCLDKGATVTAAGDTGAFPMTVEISSPDQIEDAFSQLSPPMWLRASVGPGGKASIRIDEPDDVRAWMSFWERREEVAQWVLQEFLPGRNVNWTGYYRHGELIASAAMERLKYFLGGVPISGITGQVSLCSTIDPEEYRETSERVIRALEDQPYGLYSIDFREDREGNPLVTEVNPRFAGRPWLYTNAGVNLPLAVVRSALEMPVGDAVDDEGLQIGLHLYRQLDVEPVMGYTDEREQN